MDICLTQPLKGWSTKTWEKQPVLSHYQVHYLSCAALTSDERIHEDADTCHRGSHQSASSRALCWDSYSLSFKIFSNPNMHALMRSFDLPGTAQDWGPTSLNVRSIVDSTFPSLRIAIGQPSRSLLVSTARLCVNTSAEWIKSTPGCQTASVLRCRDKQLNHDWN